MKRATFFLLSVLTPTFVAAQNQFVGTWRVKLDSVAASGKPDSYVLVNGQYQCKSCLELKRKVPADGKDHPVTGSTYLDSASVQVIDQNTVKITRKLKGKVVTEETDTVSANGKVLEVNSTQYPEGSPEPTHNLTKFTRVGDGPAGSHVISGDWKQEKVESVSENAITATFEEIPDGLKMSDPTGEQWEAKFDGKQYPVMHDPGHTMVSLKRVDPNTIEETDIRGGKTIAKIQYQVSPDGHSLRYSIHDERTGGTFDATAEKQ